MIARKPRVWYPGAIYHIMCRGNHRHNVFRDDEDRQIYLYIIREVMESHCFKLHSYCLMSNHVHLQMETGDIALGPIMKRLNMKYAIFFNKKYRFVGQLLQGRCLSEIIDTDRYMIGVSRYIHLNPVVAKMVENPCDYPWSSYLDYIYRRPTAIVETDKILGYFLKPRSVRYQKFVEDGLVFGNEETGMSNGIPSNLLLDNDDEPSLEDDCSI